MAQKSILSFFKTSDRLPFKDAENKEKQKENTLDRTKNKRKISLVKSDDESSPEKVKSGEIVNTRENGEKSNKSPSKVPKDEREDIKANGTPRRPCKTAKLENGVKESMPESSVKMEVDSPVASKGTPSTSKVETPTNHVGTPTSSSLGNLQETEFTPRRKTARKTLTPSRNSNFTSSLNKERANGFIGKDEPSSTDNLTCETNTDNSASSSTLEKSETGVKDNESKIETPEVENVNNENMDTPMSNSLQKSEIDVRDKDNKIETSEVENVNNENIDTLASNSPQKSEIVVKDKDNKIETSEIENVNNKNMDTAASNIRQKSEIVIKDKDNKIETPEVKNLNNESFGTLTSDSSQKSETGVKDEDNKIEIPEVVNENSESNEDSKNEMENAQSPEECKKTDCDSKLEKDKSLISKDNLEDESHNDEEKNETSKKICEIIDIASKQDVQSTKENESSSSKNKESGKNKPKAGKKGRKSKNAQPEDCQVSDKEIPSENPSKTKKTSNKSNKEDSENNTKKSPKIKNVKIETEKKSAVKRKAPSKESTPAKKLGKNSIQNFFAPIKKQEQGLAETTGSDKKDTVVMLKNNSLEEESAKQENKTKDQEMEKRGEGVNEKKETVQKKDEKMEVEDESLKNQDQTVKDESVIVQDEAMEKQEVKEEQDKPANEDKSVEEKGKSQNQQKNTERIAETDDSPVKKVARSKKKPQALDSDDEEVKIEPKVAIPIIKMETDDSKTPEKSSPSKDAKKTTPDSKKSPIKNKPETSSKADASKQAFGCKSTSSGTVYDPSKSRYHPIDDACWKKGEKVPYLALAKTLELIENTSGRLKIIEILSNFFRSVIVLTPEELLQSVYLCLNRLAPEYEGIEMGVGETLLMKAVAQATGRTLAQIKAEVKEKGDLGLVSESSRGNQRVMFAPPKLTLSSVFSKFLEIAKMTGNACMTKKTDKIQSLCVACRDCESKYIIRSLSGKLRIGLAEQSVLTAIARAAVLTPPGQSYPPEVIDASKGMSENKFKEYLDSQTLILKTAYCECPNYDLIIPVLLKEGISALPKCCQLEPGRPLKPMLAHPTDGIDKILERFDKNAFTCEFKYDGERAQIHMTEKGEVKIFSRNQEESTSKYPDVISRISKTLKENTKSFILDSEAVAWDTSMKQILPFQVLSTRKKKDAVESEIVVQVCIMAFDLLYLNGESLVKKSLKERRSLLHSHFNEVQNEFMFAQYRDGNSAETMQEFLDESVKGNCEGLMVKALETDASYEIAKRSHNWLKLKKDYLQGIGDTLDLVVIGGYYGKGKRTGNYGGFLLACYDEENEEFQSICKLGTGFKDDILETHTAFLKQHIIDGPKSYYRYDHSLQPDDWFEAVQVWEIKCADLSISPVHKAAMGIVDPEKGISLRFPRFIRIREDKTPEIATNSVQIAEMYQRQSQIQNTSSKNTKTDEDYY